MAEIDREAIRSIVEQVLARKGFLSSPAGPAAVTETGPAVSAGPAAAVKTVPPEPEVSGPAAQGRDSGVPVEVSARHVHLSPAAAAVLFGPGAALTEKRALSQPGEFLSDQRVRLIGPRGEIDNVAVLGPLRRTVQAEISATDARELGVDAPLRLSGDLSNAADIDITGPAGTLRAKGAAIIARIHLHLRPEDAVNYGVKNGDSVRVRVRGARPLVFEDVAVRVDEHFTPALHLDLDEANACLPGPAARAEILSDGGAPVSAVPCPAGQAEPSRPSLITETEARRMVQKCGGKISLPRGTILTPSAKDVFLHAHCAVEYTGRGETRPGEERKC
ncbi:MAG: phosphate propanoyltransferase [Treponema sp.]|jgi:propanediol utilization protein|nr:phosphate propanoyltransferase [Treponema sp.]